MSASREGKPSATRGVAINRSPLDRTPRSSSITSLGGRSLDAIASEIAGGGASLIAIDGLPGAGKSHLAAYFAKALTIRAVHLDDYLTPHGSRFIDQLDYASLECALVDRPALIEGVCVREVLDRLGLQADQHIYLQAPAAERTLDRHHCLVQDVAIYTNEKQPIERADLLLIRSPLAGGEHNPGDVSEFDAFLMRNRTRISQWLASAGFTLLAAGAAIVAIGTFVPSVDAIHTPSMDLSLAGAGFLTMIVSALWIGLAHRALAAAYASDPARTVGTLV